MRAASFWAGFCAVDFGAAGAPFLGSLFVRCASFLGSILVRGVWCADFGVDFGARLRLFGLVFGVRSRLIIAKNTLITLHVSLAFVFPPAPPS